ncbi:MAG: fatty acid desaturase [Nevskiaceae bacterium]|nr:MAG: fatty acid desaturase [Nevskiaceae bacterium]
MAQDLAALNQQAIAAAKKYMGSFAGGTVMLSIAVVAVFVANLGLYLQGSTPLWATVLVYAVATYLSYTPLHEAAHGNIHGNRQNLKWINDACGYSCAQIIMVPYSTHTVEHFTHHRFTNQSDKDPDFIVRRMADGPVEFAKVLFQFLWVQVTFLFEGHWQQAPRREKFIYATEIGIAITWRLLLLSQLPFLVWMALIVGAYLLGASFTVYWFAFRPHHPYTESARYKNTNSLIMPRWMRPLEWFWLGQNLHAIHHAFPRVPFYRYHALFREIEPVLRAHGAPILGIFDGRAVPPEQGSLGRG